ncbi:putative AP-4 complex subunit mu-1 [Apostichopus japonicus]|uniref:Putative AP-4 complex subunit mu-1 n=1 Tax=Stichopus japonicus TaxID=307972 RepID=A0A2G8LE59_STIJA|nr:putative AP-4 complex subunit mu-1 [Apostichopus japonicus]
MESNTYKLGLCSHVSIGESNSQNLCCNELNNQTTDRDATDDNNDACNKFTDWLKEARNSPLLPIKELRGCFLFHIKVSTFYLIGTTKDDQVQPFSALELLTRIKELIKEFCGSLTEEAIALNRTLIFELLDEIADFGFVRTTSTQTLKPYIQQKALPVKHARQQQTVFGFGPGLFGADFQSAPSTAADKPLSQTPNHQENGRNILDVIEKLSAVIASNVSSIYFIDGERKERTENGLSDNIVIGKLSQVGYGSQLRVDRAQFHPGVKLDQEHQTKTLSIHPPEGEFTLLKYEISSELPRGLPFRLSSLMEEFPDKQELDVQLKLYCLLPETNSAVNIKVHIPMPADTKSVGPSLPSKDQSFDFNNKDKRAVWIIKKLLGKTESVVKLRLQLNSVTSSSKLQVGPVNLEFEIKDWTCSHIQIHYLKVLDPQRPHAPQRWVRYITHSDSFTFRIR